MRVQKGDRLLATSSSHILVRKEDIKKFSLSDFHQIKKMSAEMGKEFICSIISGDK